MVSIKIADVVAAILFCPLCGNEMILDPENSLVKTCSSDCGDLELIETRGHGQTIMHFRTAAGMDFSPEATQERWDTHHEVLHQEIAARHEGRESSDMVPVDPNATEETWVEPTA